MRSKHSTTFAAAIILLALAACKNSTNVPFPDETEFAQPIGKPIRFSSPTKIDWSDSGRIKPTIKKFDVNALPSKLFDSSAFIPVHANPPEVSFNWDKLPDTIFEYDKLPSAPLQFETSMLDPPKLIKAGKPNLKSNVHMPVFELGELQGLPSGMVSCIFQDSEGFIWIGTDHELYRYDGENLASYHHLNGHAVITMHEDKKGQIWVGCSNGELFVLDLKDGLIKHVKVAPYIGGDHIINIITDEHKRIWFSTVDENMDDASKGVHIIDENDHTIKRFSRAEGLSNNAALGMIEDDKKNTWINTRQGVTIVDQNNKKIKYVRGSVALWNDNGNIWSTSDSERISVVNGGTGTITKSVVGPRIAGDEIRCKLKDSKGNIWTGTRFHGIQIFDPLKGAVKYLNESSGINGNFVFAMLKDNRGQIWIGTDKGLNVVNRSANEIEHLGPQDTITTMLEDPNGKIWMGTENSGIQILDTSTGMVRNFFPPRSADNIIRGTGIILIVGRYGLDLVDTVHKIIQHIGRAQGLRSDSLTQIMEDENGKMWIGYHQHGLDVLDMQRGTIHHLRASQCIKDSTISDIKEDEEDNVWVSTADPGELCCYVIDQQNNTIRSVDNSAKISEGGKILLRDAKGNMWIGTPDGPEFVNAQKDSLFSFSTREGLPNNQVTSLNEFGNTIYAATVTGLNIITVPSATKQRWQMESVGKTRGISQNGFSGSSNLFTEHGEFFWGDNELSIVNRPENNAAVPPTYITGINISGEQKYFTGDPWDNMNKDDTLKSAAQDTFYLNGQVPMSTGPLHQKGMKWDGVTGPFNMPVDLHLPYDQNYLQFHFAQVNLGSTDSTWYEYILDGIDKKWSKTSNSYSKNYLDLSPGNYTFKVSSLHEGKWSRPVEFEFTIRLPWWKTWWAYALYALGGLAVMSLYRSRQLIRQNKMLEEKVAKRTHELNKSLEELKATQTQLIQSEKMASLGELTAGIAHEIQNPLNFINNFSEVNKELLAELNSEIDKGNLREVKTLAEDVINNEDKINQHGKRADAIVKGMLQHSRTSSGQREPTDINRLADEYLRLAYQGFRARDKSFNATFSTEFNNALGNVNVVTQDIGRVILNLINNAFYAVNERSKQGVAGYEPTVIVGTRRLKDRIEIIIKDNGNGIPGSIKEKIFQPFFTTKPTGQGTGLGLSLAYDIVKAHGGEIKVETKENDGSKFIISLPV